MNHHEAIAALADIANLTAEARHEHLAPFEDRLAAADELLHRTLAVPAFMRRDESLRAVLDLCDSLTAEADREVRRWDAWCGRVQEG